MLVRGMTMTEGRVFKARAGPAVAAAAPKQHSTWQEMMQINK